MRKTRVITVLFISGLSLTTAASLFKPDTIFSRKEKRYLAQRPEFSADALLSGRYGREYETYLNDQFPLREPITALHTTCERLLGKCEISGIYFGADDYFIEHHQKNEYTTSLAMKNEEAVFRFLDKMSEQLGDDRVRFLPAPSAETVLTGYLPKGAPPAAENEVLDRYHHRLKQIGKEQLLVPVKDALKRAGNNVPAQAGKDTQTWDSGDKNAQLYYRTDHHWTTDGAFTAYRAWADSVGITPRQRTEFTEVTLKNDFYGSLSARVNAEVQPDSLTALIPEFPADYKIFYSGEDSPADSLYATEMLDGPEPYAVYLKGNQPLTRIQTSGTPADMSDRKLLIIKDSFGNSIAPFLVNHYTETLIIDLRYYNGSVAELIDSGQITDICIVMNPAQMAKEPSLYKLK